LVNNYSHCLVYLLQKAIEGYPIL